MNQSVAPTSFITSTSRRRAYIESRIVFATSSSEASASSAASRPIVSFTTRVAERILSVFSLRSLTSSIELSITVRWPEGDIGASASRTCTIASGSSGVTRSRSGSGLVPSRS